MDVQYYGANCIRLSTKKASILVDDNLMDLGSKSVAKNGDIVLFTGPHGDSSTNIEEKIVIDKPGEYEVSEVSIQGIAARGHDFRRQLAGQHLPVLAGQALRQAKVKVDIGPVKGDRHRGRAAAPRPRVRRSRQIGG